MKPAVLAATIFLLLVSFAHLLRVALRVEVMAGGRVVPMWMSVVAVASTASLAILLWRESHR